MPSLVAGLLQLKIPEVDATSSVSILEVHIDALESSYASNKYRISEADLPFVPRNSQLVTAAKTLSSTKCCPCFLEDAAAGMQNQAQVRGPQLSETEAACAAAQSALQYLNLLFGRFLRQVWLCMGMSID